MRLRELHLSDVVVIPGYTPMAGGTTAHREQSFHADDGWVLDELAERPGFFSVARAEMPEPVFVGGIGYSYVPLAGDAPELEEPGEAPVPEAPPTTPQGKKKR